LFTMFALPCRQSSFMHDIHHARMYIMHAHNLEIHLYAYLPDDGLKRSTSKDAHTHTTYLDMTRRGRGHLASAAVCLCQAFIRRKLAHENHRIVSRNTNNAKTVVETMHTVDHGGVYDLSVSESDNLKKTDVTCLDTGIHSEQLPGPESCGTQKPAGEQHNALAQAQDQSTTSAECHESECSEDEEKRGHSGGAILTDDEGAVIVQRVFRGHLARQVAQMERHLQLVRYACVRVCVPLGTCMPAYVYVFVCMHVSTCVSSYALL
jgi:hypothetical protein